MLEANAVIHTQDLGFQNAPTQKHVHTEKCPYLLIMLDLSEELLSLLARCRVGGGVPKVLKPIQNAPLGQQPVPHGRRLLQVLQVTQIKIFSGVGGVAECALPGLGLGEWLGSVSPGGLTIGQGQSVRFCLKKLTRLNFSMGFSHIWGGGGDTNTRLPSS